MASNEHATMVGTFELVGQGGGFLRSPARGYAVHRDDPRVSDAEARRYGLLGGESVTAVLTQADARGRHGPSLRTIELINGRRPDDGAVSTRFHDLTAIDPRPRLRLETPGGPLSMRVIDLLMPIGFGQRALIVAAPRTGKTVLLQQMAAGIAQNYPEVYMMVLLIDERPEEVTEMRRTVHGEVVASSNDRDIASHVRIARLMIASAKRRVECGQRVIILLDSLTRLGRAFNAHIRGAGRTLSGGLDVRALEEPKAIFGAARNIEDGGSLTIIASALVETGSRMDDVIFNEFKGTGNMEIVLTRVLSNKRVWPAIDLHESGTRKEELLLNPAELAVSHKVRRASLDRAPDQAMEQLLEQMKRHPGNDAFVSSYK